MKINLLPCPFCGSEDVEENYSNVSFIQGTDYQDGSIDCNQCGANVFKEAHGNAVDSLSDRLVKAWNRRA